MWIVITNETGDGPTFERVRSLLVAQNVAAAVNAGAAVAAVTVDER